MVVGDKKYWRRKHPETKKASSASIFLRQNISVFFSFFFPLQVVESTCAGRKLNGAKCCSPIKTIFIQFFISTLLLLSPRVNRCHFFHGGLLFNRSSVCLIFSVTVSLSSSRSIQDAAEPVISCVT